jgi:hypothetical protein
MASFDWKAFGAAFLGEVTEGIEERGEEAKKYKEQQEAAAERNQGLIAQRTSRARQAAQYGRQAETLMQAYPQGKTIVRQAMASGMGTVQELYEKLYKAANAPGQNGRLGVDDIEAIINMPNIPAVDKSLMDMSLEDYAKKTYGASTATQMAAPEDDTSTVGQLFGFGAKKRVKQQLAEQDFGSGMTVAEINRLAKQEEYTSLIPGATMLFNERNMFDTDKAFDFSKKITEVTADAIKGDQAEAYIKSARLGAMQPGMSSAEQMAAAGKAEAQAIKDLQIVAAKPLIDYYADVYHTGKFFDNRLAVQTIAGVMGEGYVDTLKEMYNIEAPDGDADDAEPIDAAAQAEAAAQAKAEAEAEAASAKAAAVKATSIEPKPAGRGKLREQRAWDRKYKDKYDPETGEPIIVPPRPGKEATRDETKLSGRVVKINLYDEWMDEYGDTHNIDGTPKPVED